MAANASSLTVMIKWCNERDPLDIEGDFTAIISDREIQIPLKIPHEVAHEVEE